MNLNERYRIHNKKKSNKTLLIYLAVFTLLVFSNSFSRYVNNSNKTLALEIANWNIKINDIQINESTRHVQDGIYFVVTENQSNDGLIKPGQSGYFDIKIDPQYTEVSLKYKITIDKSSLPEGIELKNYSINNSTQKQKMPNNNIIKDSIYIESKTHLDSEDVRIYRIYWEWDSSKAKIENIKNDYKIKANVQIEQIIDE